MKKANVHSTKSGNEVKPLTATGLCLSLLGHCLLLPFSLGLLNQALLARVLMLDFCALSLGGKRRLAVNTIDETGNESRVTENLYRRKVVNIQFRMGWSEPGRHNSR